MEVKLKKACGRICKDIHKYWIPCLVIGIYIIVTSFLFGTSCPSGYILGLPCPGCGITRAGIMVLTGRLAEAWDMNPLIYGVILLAVMGAWLRYWKGTDVIVLKKYLYLLIGTAILVYIYRMIGLYPDREPMVYRGHAVIPSLFQELRLIFGW